MTVASISTASARPTPNNLRKLTSAVPKARKVTASRTDAALTIRPVRSSPRATDAALSPVASYSSLMRDRRNTS